MDDGLYTTFWPRASTLIEEEYISCVIRDSISVVVDDMSFYDSQYGKCALMKNAYYHYAPVILLEDK